mmetsp:Transcript_26522/g.47627  ORF Transcript_26522/g.47627 Transcript_26522/m.47627 type:complete len:531 (+) Transcript_26522:3260-4852(+)
MHIVRSSKYRHVYGEELPEKFEDIRPSLLSSEGHLIKANGSFVAFAAEIGGGGALALLSMRRLGRQPPNFPLIKGHSGKVIDYDFNPFNDNQLLSCSDDATLKLWGFPDEGLTEDLITPLQTLNGHGKKVSLVSFHPSASFVAASTSFDHTIKLWNIETGAIAVDITGLPDIALSLAWNYEGNSIGTTNKDKRVRIYDARSKVVEAEITAHEGGKPAKFSWLDPDSPQFYTVGFSRLSGRQYAIWDRRNLASSVFSADIDSAAGVLMPFYDIDTKMMYLAGKGDGNIRYYEITQEPANGFLLESFKSTTPCRGVTFMPKRKVDTSVCEVMRAFKLTNASVDVISFRVPRRSEAFQEDIYPDVVGATAALNAERWFGGETKRPLTEPIRQQTASSPTVTHFHESKAAVVESPKLQVHAGHHTPTHSANDEAVAALKQALEDAKKAAQHKDDELAETKSQLQAAEGVNSSLKEKLTEAEAEAALHRAKEHELVAVLEESKQKQAEQEARIAELLDRLQGAVAEVEALKGASQ